MHSYEFCPFCGGSRVRAVRGPSFYAGKRLRCDECDHFFSRSDLGRAEGRLYERRVLLRIGWLSRSLGRAVTRAQIARALGVSKCPYLIGIIERLVTRGDLVRFEAPVRGGHAMHYVPVPDWALVAYRDRQRGLRRELQAISR